MRILLVEDDEKLKNSLAFQLQQEGFIVDTCSDGEEALYYIEQNIHDLILLDRMLPYLSGTDVLSKMRGGNNQTPVILITALGTLDDKVQGLDLGADDYLVKPFDDDKFASVLQTAVNRRLEKSVNAAASLVITKGGEHITVNPQEIIYAEVFDRKIILHTLQDEIEYYGKMKELEKKVGEDFYRPHRAYLVNMNYIRKYDATAIYLSKGQALMAKQNYQDFVKCYLRYIRRKGTEEDVQ